MILKRIFNLIGQLVAWGLSVVFVGLIALGAYFYYKAGQPMQVEEAQRLAPGITYRQFWADRVQQWREIDDQKEAQGKGRSCALVPTLMLPMMYAGSVYEVSYLRIHRGTKEADNFLRSISNIMPPDELIYGPWWKLPDGGGGKLKICLGGLIIDRWHVLGIVKLALFIDQQMLSDNMEIHIYT
jgi:hypothetical protein